MSSTHNALAAAGLLVLQLGCAPELPERPFPAPTGSWDVGMREYQWTDAERSDPFTADVNDRRRVPVRIWYPAVEQTADPSAPYILDPTEFTGVEDVQGAAHVRTNAHLDAEVAADRFPLLLYNHGGGWPRFTGTFIGEELASHGYIVASVGHDGFNQSTQRPDGSSAANDALPFPEQGEDLKAGALAAWDHLEEHFFPQWIADNLYALARLEELAVDSSSPFAGRLDLGLVGALGWSFGGATAIQLLSQDRRVTAAVDMDGQLFGGAHTRGAAAPFMLLKSTGVDVPPSETEEERERTEGIIVELVAMVTEREDALIAASTADWYRVEVAESTHGTFSDFLHLTPDGIGEIGSERGHQVLTGVTRAFFDRYLKAAPATALDQALTSFAELSVERN
ncbi:MAG: hypothetical protein VYE73_16060 [Acidobacteriota bacterium]|nr:hypothetical protein [Acidobacteriota bacterium]